MFEDLEALEADPILGVMLAYRADARAEKIDLGIGIYKDSEGSTPIMAAVREAEKRLFASQTTKAYVAPGGDETFNAAMCDVVFGTDRPAGRVRAIQTPGGSGALRVVMDLIKNTRPDATLWVSEPTWPNHHILAGAAALTVARYPYFDPDKKTVCFADMLEGLRRAKSGDAVLLHGCCHNPSGADLDIAQWRDVAALIAERGLLAFVDIAYQGLGDGLETDAAGLRLLASELPEMVVAASCSKNFGLYRDRVGCAFVLAADSDQADVARQHAVRAVRGNYSMPPDHGAAVVSTILGDPELRGVWLDELDTMRQRVQSLRRALADSLRLKTNSDRFDFFAEHRGLFSLTGLSPEQVAALREGYGIYLIGDGRMNVAGLTEDNIDAFADALIAVTSRA
ncbi:MAG: amino acid aminotransferase [Pseudomonadota bacterium]